MSYTVRENSDIKSIMIHHTATSERGVWIGELIEKFLQNNQFGVPYDIVIDKKGIISLSARWVYGGYAKYYIRDANLGDIIKFSRHHLSAAGDTYQENTSMLHIALIGNFDHEEPTPIQVARLRDVIEFTKNKIPSIDDVLYHADNAATTCPGRHFVSKTDIGVGDSASINIMEPKYEALRPRSIGLS